MIVKFIITPTMVSPQETLIKPKPKSSDHSRAIPNPSIAPKKPNNAIAMPISFFLIFIIVPNSQDKPAGESRKQIAVVLLALYINSNPRASGTSVEFWSLTNNGNPKLSSPRDVKRSDLNSTEVYRCEAIFVSARIIACIL